jgi:hypothetical protein
MIMAHGVNTFTICEDDNDIKSGDNFFDPLRVLAMTINYIEFNIMLDTINCLRCI